jgi:hypothetical protein
MISVLVIGKEKIMFDDLVTLTFIVLFIFTFFYINLISVVTGPQHVDADSSVRLNSFALC